MFEAISKIYAGVNALRNRLFDNGLLKVYHSKLPVVSVGNVTVGGSGKTPFASYLAELLKERGYRPVILMRGYGGKIAGPHLVSDEDSVVDVGDEAIEHFSGAAENVVVSRKRVAGAKFIEENDLGNVIILDDGFQHRYLARDINFLLLDISREQVVSDVLENNILPKGLLRENAGSAIARADIVVLVSRGVESECPQKLLQLFKDKTTCKFIVEPSSFVDVVSGEIVAVDKFASKRANALTAIANPEGFFQMLKGLGVDLASQKSYRDHYQFSSSDLNKVTKSQLPVLVTKKDATKLKSLVSEPNSLFFLEIKGKISSQNEPVERNILDSIAAKI